MDDGLLLGSSHSFCFNFACSSLCCFHFLYVQSISILFYVCPQQGNIRQEKIQKEKKKVYIRQQLQQQHYMELIRLSPASGFCVPRDTHQVGWRARWRVDLRVERVEAIC